MIVMLFIWTLNIEKKNMLGLWTLKKVKKTWTLLGHKLSAIIRGNESNQEQRLQLFLTN